MLRYIMVGTNDVPRSGRFYAAILTPLGYDRKGSTDNVVFALPDIPDRFNGPGAVYVTKPYDGRRPRGDGRQRLDDGVPRRDAGEGSHPSCCRHRGGRL
jgi:hypothetical protein